MSSKDDQATGDKSKDKRSDTDSKIKELQDEVARLKDHNDRILAQRKKDQDDAKKAADDAEAARLEAAKKDGDAKSIDESWQKKYDKLSEDLKVQLAEKDAMITDITVNQNARTIAAQLAVDGSDSVMVDHIQKRLSMEIREGRPTTVVLDADGKPSALTIDELKTEFSENPAFAPLIRGNKASGSGGINSGGSASKLDRAKMTLAEKTAYQDEHGQEAYLKLPNSNLTTKEA